MFLVFAICSFLIAESESVLYVHLWYTMANISTNASLFMYISTSMIIKQVHLLINLSNWSLPTNVYLLLCQRHKRDTTSWPPDICENKLNYISYVICDSVDCAYTHNFTQIALTVWTFTCMLTFWFYCDWGIYIHHHAIEMDTNLRELTPSNRPKLCDSEM